jgi:glycosyltransferase involved in cell wall biosynthesis
MHICNWNAVEWVKKGGDKKRIVLVSHPMEIDFKGGDMRIERDLVDKFIYGFHQRKDNEIFSDLPLKAYKKIESDDTFFILLGGGDKYRIQAKELDIKNIMFLEHTGDHQKIYSFLNTLNVYSHGRKDGEVNSTAMAEAMYFGLPIISHISDYSNGHIECIGNAGRVVENIDEYVKEMILLKNDKTYYEYKSQEAKKRFEEKYELKGQMRLIEKIYEDVVKDPFPNKIRRCIYNVINRCKISFCSIVIIPYHGLKRIIKFIN